MEASRQMFPPPAQCIECPLKDLALFTPVSDRGIQDIQSARKNIITVENRELVYSIGDVKRNAYTLFNGYAITFQILPNGRRQILRLVLPGDLLFDWDRAHQTWYHSAEAVGGASFCVFPADSLERFMNEQPENVRRLAYITAAEERLLAAHLTDVGRRAPLDRVARLMIELFARMRVRGRLDGSDRCHLPFTQGQIADAIGLSAVHVSRLFRELNEMRILTYRRQLLTIYDVEDATQRFDYDMGLVTAVRPLL